jgi:hypothetical protein
VRGFCLLFFRWRRKPRAAVHDGLGVGNEEWREGGGEKVGDETRRDGRERVLRLRCVA